MDMDRAPARAANPTFDVEEHIKQEILGRSLLAALEGESRVALLGLATLARLPRRRAVATQGEPPHAFLLVGSGRIKVERQRGDRTLPLGHRGPGEMVGETALDGSPAAGESASVIDEVEALSLPVTALVQRLAVDAPLRAVVSAAIVRQHRVLERRIEDLLLHGVEARLEAFLLDAARRWGQLHAEGDVIATAFTHAEIAGLIGSTRETVTLILGKLKRDGLLAFDRRRIVIRDRAGLAQRLESSAA